MGVRGDCVMTKTQYVHIENVCKEIFAGGDVPKNALSYVKTEECCVPIFSNGEKDDGLYGYTNHARVNEPSITVSARGTIGYTSKRCEPFFPVVRLITLTPKDDVIDLDYLFYATQNYKFEGSGTSIPQLTVPMLKKYAFPLPKQEEQKAIAKLFQKLDCLISLRKQQLVKLDELVKARFVEMFGELHKTEYNIKTLDELCEFIKDGTHRTPTYVDVTEGYKFLSSKDVTSGYIDWSSIKYISEELHQELYKRIAPQRGDILLAKNGTTGIPAIVETDETFDIYVSLALLRLKPNNNVRYIWSALRMPETKAQFDNSLKGVGVPNLHLGEIKKTKIIAPPFSLQNQFAAFVEHVDQQKQTVQQSLEKLELMKKALMQEYFG